jgi:uncharacterized protein
MGHGGIEQCGNCGLLRYHLLSVNNTMHLKALYKRLIAVAILAYVGICAYLYMFQRDILYHPSPIYAAPNPSALLAMQEVEVLTQDGITLHSWYAPAPPHAPTIVFLHGNAGGLQERTPTYHAIIEAGYGLLALEYRGYSGNAGRPTEEGLYHDGRAAFTYLQTQGVAADNVVLMGHSLGTGVAVQLATEYPLHALVLIAPFTSMVAMANEQYWYVPAGVLLKDRYDSLSKAARVEEPVLIFHGQNDALIPVAHAVALDSALTSAPRKHLVIDPSAKHNDVPMDSILTALETLLQ